MAVTPDLAPGARSRILVLLGITAGLGALTYYVFERAAILWISLAVVVVLLYLLLGVRLTLNAERRALAPVLEAVVGALSDRYWLVVDAGGTVLRMSPAGEEGLGHDAAILVDQRLADLVPMTEGPARAALAELLRFASAGSFGDRPPPVLPILAEDGTRRTIRLRPLPLEDPAARRAGLIALAGERLG